MNAIDIFGGKSHANPDALSTFLKGSSPGAALGSQPKVTITKGALSLQVMAYGQKQKGFWQSFFSYITSIIGNPTTATALTGFGIPGLAVDALQFVDHALTELTKNEGLIPLWQTGSLDFGIAPKTKAIFKMRPGIWLTIDHDYASDSKLLDGHSLDLALGSYRLYDKDKKMADANYLVTDFGFDAAS